MVPTTHYPRWKFIVMQITLWGVLGGTVALAGWVTQVRSLPLPGAADVQLGSFGIRMPAGWEVGGRHGVRSQLVAREPVRGGMRRTLTVIHQKLPGPMLPRDYLNRTGLMPAGGVGQWDFEGTLGPYPLVVVYSLRELPRGGGKPQVAKDLRMCTVLPNGEALTVYLNGIGPIEEQDEALLLQFMQEVRVTAPQGGEAPSRVPPEQWQGV